MGRLRSASAQILAIVGFLLLVPAAVWGTARLEMASGAPGMGLLLPLVVALLLSVGPRAGPAVVAAFVLDAVVVGGQPLTLITVAVAVGQAALAVALVLFLERRLAYHGPVRSPVVVVEFAAIVAVALPLLVSLLPEVVASSGLTRAWPGPYAQRVLAGGIGVLTIAPGVRMLLVRRRLGLERSVVVGVWAAALVTVTAVWLTLWFGGVGALVNAQVVALPLLLLALFVGTAGYAIGVALSTLGVLVPLTLMGTDGAAGITTPIHGVWFLVAFLGMLLATDGDRRRAAAVEFRTFFQHSATPTLSVNAGTGLVTQGNTAAAELLGSADLAGRPVIDLVGADDQVRDRLSALLVGEIEEFTGEFALGGAGDDVRWVRCAALRVALPNPQADLLQVQFLDLTTERERAAALERSNQALQRFGRRVTHDLKQPLAAVAAYASTLAEHGERMDPSVVRTMYERLEAVALRAVTQLDDTFSAAAVTSSGSESVNLTEVVASVVGVIDIDLTETGGTVDTALAVSQVHADGSMLRQVLLNLLTNSLKYARQDRPPRIRVSSRVRGAGVEVTVTDNGTGIPADQLTAVFERGRRLDPDRADGRGHGLADSRDLAESAGGWLRAEPWPEGARFTLWLPDPTAAGVAGATRVLLVDDEPDALTVLSHRLELASGIEVVGTAATLDEAVGATRELRPDVVLLDRWLRDQDGLAGVVELARAHPDVRIILLTAHMTPDLHERARDGGVLRTLDKAVSDEDLVAQVIGSTT